MVNKPEIRNNVSKRIHEIINRSEGQYFDRKSAKIKIPKLVETILAFANADGGTIALLH